MEISLLELGYFTERDCKKLESILNHKTFMDLIVSHSNYAGNCSLIIKTDYDAPEEDIIRTFMFVALNELARLVR